MKYKIYDKSNKIAIVKRYLQGEKINNLTKELWPNVKGYHRRANIYNWINKYGNGKWYYQTKKIKIAKKKYHPELKYNFVMRYLAGESPTKLAKEIWDPKFADSRRKSIETWRDELISKGKIPKDIKRIPKRGIKYKDLTKEELIEIIKIYDKYIKIINDKDKKKKFAVISQIKSNIFSILRLCKLFGVSKSGYFKWKKHLPPKRDEELYKLVERLFIKHKKMPGYRKMVYYILRENGIKYNHKKIYRIMKELNLKSKIRVKKGTKKEAKSSLNKFEYLIKRDFKANQPFEKIFTDVTYIRLSDYTYAYLSATIDSYSNRIVSFEFSKKNNSKLVINSIQNLLKYTKNITPIINSDHGIIYFSKSYLDLSKQKFKISMSRIGNCLDNRPIEYWFSILKSELIEQINFQERNFEKLKYEIKKFIKYYNESRIQSCLNYLTPNEYEKQASNLVHF